MTDLARLEAALRAADAAGDHDAARRLARAYRDAKAAGANSEWQPRRWDLNAIKAESARVRAGKPDEASGSFGENFMAGVGKSVRDTALGVGQVMAEGGPGGMIARAIGERLRPKTTADLIHPGQRDQMDIGGRISDYLGGLARDNEQIDANLMRTGGGIIGNIAGQVAQMAIPGKALSLPNTLRSAAAVGGLFSGAQPVTGDESRLANAAEGAAWGAGGQVLSNAVGAVANRVRPAAEKTVQDAVAFLEKRGVPLHLSQTMDSGFLRLVGSVVNKLPFSGAQQAGRNQQAAFNRELGKTIGLDGVTNFSDDVLATAKRRIGNAYETLFARNSVKIGPETLQDLQALNQRIGSDLGPEAAGIVRNQIKKFIAKVDATGGIPGRAYQNVRETLFSLESAPGHGHLVREVRKVFERAAQRSFQGSDAQALRVANERYANLKTIEKALKQVAGAGGDVRPASLWPLVNQKYGAPAEMRDLARAGQLVLKDGIPDSGTSQRELVTRLLGLGAGGTMTGTLPLVAKGAAAGALLGRALNSQTAARVIPGAGRRVIEGVSRPLPKVLPVLGPALTTDR